MPDTTFRIDLFASAAYNADGSGEAEDYLGSLQVTTDPSGQVVFAVPFTAPAGLPIVTATATDPYGNTSEVSALRRAILQAPSHSLRMAANQPLTLATMSGDGIAIQDLDTGPFNPTWKLTISVSAGTLTLSTTAGLSGSGDGTGTLSYSGSLPALDTALEGLTYTPPAGRHVFATLTVNAQSSGAPPLEAQLVLTDGVFVVTTTADSGPGSLRQAILDANTVTDGPVTIDFAIPGAGVQTIEPVAPLPPITTSVLIDGTTQPGFAGTPLIAFSGLSPGSPGSLIISGGNDTVRGLALASVTIDATVGQRLIAVVAAQGAASQLSLVDAQGHVLVQSDGVSPDDPDAAIDQYLTAGDYSLAVDSRGGQGAYTWTTMLTPAAAAPFEPIPVGSSPFSIVAGDFNGDGRLDLAVADSSYNSVTNTDVGEVSVLLGNGDGTFQPAVQYAVGMNPGPIVAGDFTGDGRLDLAVATSSYDSVTYTDVGEVSVLLGNGDGTFQPAVQYAVGINPLSIVAGDFTGDGKLDLAVACQGDVSFFGSQGTDPGGVYVLLGNADGTFQPAVQYAAGSHPGYLVVGDFNGDGRLDLTVTYIGNYSTSQAGVSVLLGNGDGTFQPAKTVATGIYGPLVAGDFTGDGHLDLAFLNIFDNDVSVLLGNGDGTFQPAVQYAAGIAPDAIVAGDFTGDGRVDLAVTNSPGGSGYSPGTVSVLLGNGDGTFQHQVTYGVGEFPSSIVAGDFTGGGRLDLAVANLGDNTVSVLMGNGDGSFQAQAQRRTRRGRNQVPSWRRTSTATAGSTWPSPTMARTMSRSCWPMAMARSSPRSSTLSGRTRVPSWRATSMATDGSTSPWSTTF